MTHAYMQVVLETNFNDGRKLAKMKFFFHFLFAYTLLTVWSDAKPWPGHDATLKSREYLSALHRSRRNHRVNDRKNNFDEDLSSYDDRLNNYDDEDAYDNEEDDYEIIKKAKRAESLQYTVNKWLKLADRNKIGEYMDPYDLDVYMEPKLPMHRKAAKDESVKMVASNLNRIRALEERLRHIERMKQSLSKKIRKLQLLKEQESNTKLRIENEVSEAEREWKYNVDRMNPGSYRPLDRLGDTSHIF